MVRCRPRLRTLSLVVLQKVSIAASDRNFSYRNPSFLTENQLLATTGPTGRPVRANRGGRLAQMMETSELLCQGLGKRLAATGGKRPHNQVNSAPDDLPDNTMAPPLKAKRRRVNLKVFFFKFNITSVPSGDRLLQTSNPVVNTVSESANPPFPIANHSEGPLQVAPLPIQNIPANIRQNVCSSQNGPNVPIAGPNPSEKRSQTVLPFQNISARQNVYGRPNGPGVIAGSVD